MDGPRLRTPGDRDRAPGSSVVLLFRDADSLTNYRGWVFYPAENDSTTYRKAVLSPMDEAPGLFDITVNSVFAVDADRAPGPELVVLYESYRAGSGAAPAHAAYVYTWTGGSFDVGNKRSSSIVGLDNEGDIRSKLATTDC
jgi:hypothetical protein